MTNVSSPRWHSKRTDETRQVEERIREAGFSQVDAYRFNSAAIRVRVVDPRFEGLSTEQRDALVEPHLQKLPERTQADILSLFTFTPAELREKSRAFLLNSEFEDPSESIL